MLSRIHNLIESSGVAASACLNSHRVEGEEGEDLGGAVASGIENHVVDELSTCL